MFPPTTVTVTTPKGGVGKTTMAVHIAAGLAAKGYRVGLLDTDPQGHCSVLLNMPDDDGLYSVMISKQPIDQHVQHVDPRNYSHAKRPSKGELYLLASGWYSSTLPRLLSSAEVFLFPTIVKRFQALYNLQVIIIDTPASVNDFSVGAVYPATDRFLYVTQAEKLSLKSIRESLLEMEEFGEQREEIMGRAAKLMGIIPNLVRDTSVSQRNIAVLREAFPDHTFPLVNQRTIWTEAANSNETVFTYKPRRREAAEAWVIVDAVEAALCQQTEKTN